MTALKEPHLQGMKWKFLYSMTGLLLGFVCIVSGVVLGLYGVVGHTTWTASVLGLSTSLTDAAPGVVVFIVGIVMVFITRFRVKETTVLPDGTRHHIAFSLGDRPGGLTGPARKPARPPAENPSE